MARTGFLGLIIEQSLKNKLLDLKKKDGATLTYHLEKAIELYLHSIRNIKNGKN